MSSMIGTEASVVVERDQLERLGHSIRGKLQFMDYLVRAAIADVDRCLSEPDPGTRGFLRELVEMHTSSLAHEAQYMSRIDDLLQSIKSALDSEPALDHRHSPDHDESFAPAPADATEPEETHS